MKLLITAILKIIIQSQYEEYQQFAELAGVSRQNLNGIFKQNDLLYVTAVKMLELLDYDIFAVSNNEAIQLKTIENVTNTIAELLHKTFITKAKLAQRLNISYGAIMKFFKQPNVKFGTIVKVFNALGYEVEIKSQKHEKTYIVGTNDYWNYILETTTEQITGGSKGESNMYIGATQIIDKFYLDCLEIELTSTLSTMPLWNAFEKYCNENKYRGLPYKDFIKLFKEKAILYNNGFVGLKLKGAAI